MHRVSSSFFTARVKRCRQSVSQWVVSEFIPRLESIHSFIHRLAALQCERVLVWLEWQLKSVLWTTALLLLLLLFLLLLLPAAEGAPKSINIQSVIGPENCKTAMCAGWRRVHLLSHLHFISLSLSSDSDWLTELSARLARRHSQLGATTTLCPPVCPHTHFLSPAKVHQIFSTPTYQSVLCNFHGYHSRFITHSRQAFSALSLPVCSSALCSRVRTIESLLIVFLIGLRLATN